MKCRPTAGWRLVPFSFSLMSPSVQVCPKIPVSNTAVSRSGDWLTVNFPEAYASLSWAVLGGAKAASSVVWLRVKNQDLHPGVDPAAYLRERIDSGLAVSDVVGLLTSANLDNYADVQKSCGEYEARCVATVGLSNAVRIGDAVEGAWHSGTINLLCFTSHPLTYEARLEAVSLAAEARTAAVLAANILSPASGLPSTGTGTDCIVIASPQFSGADGIKYAGKHTPLGSLIGGAVYEAVRLGVERWKP